ncbi:MAG: lipoprotein NlpD [Paraglaciecola sp.]|jgi:lipoprotein NlpD
MSGQTLLMQITGQLCVFVVCISLAACSGRKVPAPVSELYQGKTFREHTKKSFSGEHYKVKKGDTLFTISWLTGRDYQDIAKLNHIPAPYHIYPGQRLSLIAPPPKLTGKKYSRPIVDTLSKNQVVDHQKKQGYSGLTSNADQVVDHQKKQAYGKAKSIDRKRAFVPPNSEFPNQIKSWLWPTKNPVTRGFSGAEQGNKGLDFLGTLGSPVLVTAAGKVVYTGDALRGYGKLIIVKHSDSFLSAYAHNDRILVKEQQWIRAGQKIATMGKSGSDRIKLHFEVRYKGKSVDPLRYLPKR